MPEVDLQLAQERHRFHGNQIFRCLPILK